MQNTLSTTSRQRRQWLTLAGASVLTACVGPGTAPLRIATHQWIGHELLHLANRLDLLPQQHVRLIDMPSSSASMRALTAGAVEGACLSLDQVLVARERGVPLTVVAVTDKSIGADAIIAHADITDLSGLKGRRLGFDRDSASGVLLAGALESSGLSLGSLSVLDLSADRYLDAFFKREVDALVVQEPYKTLLSQSDMQILFASNSIPDQIINTIVVRTDALEQRKEQVQTLVRAHFKTLEQWQENPAHFVTDISKHSVAEPGLLLQAFEGIQFLSERESKGMLSGSNPPLETLAVSLAKVMVRAHLLRHTLNAPHFAGLTSSRFHP